MKSVVLVNMYSQLVWIDKLNTLLSITCVGHTRNTHKKVEFVSTIAFWQCINWLPNELTKCEGGQKVGGGRLVLKNGGKLASKWGGICEVDSHEWREVGDWSHKPVGDGRLNSKTGGRHTLSVNVLAPFRYTYNIIPVVFCFQLDYINWAGISTCRRSRSSA